MGGVEVHDARVEPGLDAAAVGRLTAYFEKVGNHLPRREQRESFATYFFGILSDGERKSVEPIAARACGDPDAVERAHDRLLHFLGRSPWSDQAVRREAARHAIAAMTVHAPVTTWIIDDTGFLKQGSHSVGVQRQYTGSAGKVTNCQIWSQPERRLANRACPDRLRALPTQVVARFARAP